MRSGSDALTLIILLKRFLYFFFFKTMSLFSIFDYFEIKVHLLGQVNLGRHILVLNHRAHSSTVNFSFLS